MTRRVAAPTNEFQEQCHSLVSCVLSRRNPWWLCDPERKSIVVLWYLLYCFLRGRLGTVYSNFLVITLMMANTPSCSFSFLLFFLFALLPPWSVREHHQTPLRVLRVTDHSSTSQQKEIVRPSSKITFI